MIEYSMPLFRPPSEAKSFILQATIGCSHNECTYCAMYREETQKFRIRPTDEIKAIIDEASEKDDFDRVFIADGNALSIPQKRLVEIMEYLNKKCPHLERISMYANIGDILRKGVENLKALRELGLQMVYIGFESGDEVVLQRIKKGANYEQTVRACQMLKELEIIVENTNLTDGFFFANHISNYLPIKAKFPEDKEMVLEEIRMVLRNRDESVLRPEYYRDVINQY